MLSLWQKNICYQFFKNAFIVVFSNNQELLLSYSLKSWETFFIFVSSSPFICSFLTSDNGITSIISNKDAFCVLCLFLNQSFLYVHNVEFKGALYSASNQKKGTAIPTNRGQWKQQFVRSGSHLVQTTRLFTCFLCTGTQLPFMWSSESECRASFCRVRLEDSSAHQDSTPWHTIWTAWRSRDRRAILWFKL